MTPKHTKPLLADNPYMHYPDKTGVNQPKYHPIYPGINNAHTCTKTAHSSDITKKT